MELETVKKYNDNLAESEELSEHNKQVINDFLRHMETQGLSQADISGVSSRLSTLGRIIDFQMDQASRKDIKKIVAELNTDQLRKLDGGTYSDCSKESFWNTITRFYNGFIKKESRGYNKNLDGTELVDGLEVKTEIETKVDPRTKPSPEQIKKLVESAKCLRDKALIMFCWASGCRVGEVFQTPDDEKPLKWKHIRFEEDKLWAKISESGTHSRGKTGERKIPLRVSMPLMRKLWEKSDKNLEDPVFLKKNSPNFCPKCDSKLEYESKNRSYSMRIYNCSNCGWSGEQPETLQEKQPLTANAVRRIIERCFNRTNISQHIDTNPHAVFRKSRAIYKAYIGWTEYQLRAFFGWSPNSDAPKHYIEIVKEGLEKALMEEFGEEYEPEIDKDALKPLECPNCETVNSSAWSYCQECNTALENNELRRHNDRKNSEQLKQEKKTEFFRKLLTSNTSAEGEELEKLAEETIEEPAIQ